MKTTALAIITILIGFSSVAQSADSATSGQKEFRKMERKNYEKLNLTEDQKAKIKTLNETFRQQMQDLSKNTNVSADELKDKHDALIKDHKEKINTILTPEQRKQAADMKQEYGREKDHDKRGQRFEEMTKDLNLTPEQSAKMKDLNETLRTNIQSIHQNTSLNQDEKKDQMKGLMKKHKEDMEALLTNEQKEQLKNNFKNKRKDVVKN